jgi:hypothetical protein
MRSSVLVAAAAALAFAAPACASREVAPVVHADEMRGFTPEEARAVVDTHIVEPCSVFTGELVVEVVDAVVREWPKEPGGGLEKKKQPMILTELRGPGSGTGTTDIVPLVAPEAYARGESMRWFVGRRLLQRPLRTLAGRLLTVRLAKNNRTAEPLWEEYATRTTAATLGAVSAVGLPSVPREGADLVFEMIRRLTPDDRVLEWSASVDAWVASLQKDGHKAARVTLSTSRTASGMPSAELDLLIHVQSEPECP